MTMTTPTMMERLEFMGILFLDILDLAIVQDGKAGVEREALDVFAIGVGNCSGVGNATRRNAY
ncbi:MAG: hypothetical protein IPK83_23765 [Planctomycetes bacterium]|nr:hypothetical protein [Planctomycetota bacterium]